MCGEPRRHASLAFLDRDQPERVALQEALLYLLVSQYVRVPGCDSDGKVSQVMVGSGMGQTASGEIADTSFLELAEVNFACLKEVQHLHKVHKYIRYRDDIFVAYSDSNLLRDFFDRIKSLLRGSVYS